MSAGCEYSANSSDGSTPPHRAALFEPTSRSQRKKQRKKDICRTEQKERRRRAHLASGNNKIEEYALLTSRRRAVLRRRQVGYVSRARGQGNLFHPLPARAIRGGDAAAARRREPAAGCRVSVRITLPVPAACTALVAPFWNFLPEGAIPLSAGNWRPTIPRTRLLCRALGDVGPLTCGPGFPQAHMSVVERQAAER